eukprot:403334078
MLIASSLLAQIELQHLFILSQTLHIEASQENLELNKKHYTYMNRATKNRVLNYFQNKGAKVHFNTIKIEDTEVIDQTGKLEYLNLRYGVIQYEDLVRDLSYWETMLVSSLMQRPIKTAINSDEIWEHQAKNLRSALAISALDIKDGDKETKLYESIVNIPHYHNKFMTILDKEDEEKIVKENYAKFQEMYHPIWKDTFSNCLEIKDGKISITQDTATRKYLMSHLNDNVFQNIDKVFSLKSYDEDMKFHKHEMKQQKKEEIAQELIIESKDNIEEQNKDIFKSIDKILITHRNTKFFLFVMSWQFFLAYFLFKKFFQGLFLYYIYKKSKNASEKLIASGQPVPDEQNALLNTANQIISTFEEAQKSAALKKQQ